jgi:hypothetical protein
VLLPEDVEPELFLPALRRRLSEYRPDDFEGYRPHVTTTEERVVLPLRYLALMSKGKVIYAWPLSGPAGAQEPREETLVSAIELNANWIQQQASS